jgi:hypothetical protein
MRDVYRAASEGFRIFGGATEFGATGRRPLTTAIGRLILSGSAIQAYQSFAGEGPRLRGFKFYLVGPRRRIRTFITGWQEGQRICWKVNGYGLVNGKPDFSKHGDPEQVAKQCATEIKPGYEQYVQKLSKHLGVTDQKMSAGKLRPVRGRSIFHSLEMVAL